MDRLERVTAGELAERVGIAEDEVLGLADRSVIERDEDGRFAAGDVHRLRLLNAFAEAGVPLDALIEASDAGTISLRYYDQLHPPPEPLSSRTYAAFRASRGDRSNLLTRLFGAFGLAEPDDAARLGTADEALIGELLEIVAAIGEPDLALRAIRLFGEGARRAADGALDVYGEAVGGTADELEGLPIDAVFDRSLRPWARFARQATGLAGWLMTRHMARAIDQYSVASTERILEEQGFVAARAGPMPAVAFVDLSGFTKLTEERGDEAAAAVALRLGDVAAETVGRHAGRVVKLLGDGVLVRFPALGNAVDATLALLDALPAAGLPGGHAGIAAGPLIMRDNDVFGRTVNLAARISDVAPDGEAYLPGSAAATLAPDERWSLEPVEAAVLQGIGRVELAAVRRNVVPTGDRPRATSPSAF